MERKKKKLGGLMTKFSHAFWILKYYGTYSDCEKLMTWLCTQSRTVWETIHKSLVNNGRRDLEYVRPFDKSISDFLIADRYQKYTLSVTVNSSDSAGELCRFIEAVPEFYQLRFKKITWELIDKPEYLTSLYKRMIMLNLPDKVFVNNHQRFVYEYVMYKSLKNYLIPYVHHLDKIEEIKYAEKIGSLEITAKDMEMGKIKEINIPVNEFIFRDRQTMDLIFNKPLKFDKQLLDSLTSLYFVEIPLAWVFLGTSALSTVCTNLKEYRIYFKKVSDICMGLFNEIQKSSPTLTCTSLSLKYKPHIPSTISKSFMKLIYKEGPLTKIIHTSHTYIQLSPAQEEIIHHTPEYLILSNLNSCHLTDVRVTDEDDDQLFKGVSKYRIHLKHSCFIILNGFFDRVVIGSYESMLAVNPYGCELLDMSMDEEFRGLKWLKFCNFFKRVSVFTKLSFRVEMEERPFGNLLDVLKVIEEMEVISFSFVITKSVRDKMRTITKEKVKKWILGLPQLRTYSDGEVTIRNVDQYDGIKKLERHLNESILQCYDPDEEEIEDTFIDYLEISS